MSCLLEVQSWTLCFSLVSVGSDTCRDNHIETEVRFGTMDRQQYVCAAPPHSTILIGSASDAQVFNHVPRDPGSLCAVDYNQF